MPILYTYRRPKSKETSINNARTALLYNTNPMSIETLKEYGLLPLLALLSIIILRLLFIRNKAKRPCLPPSPFALPILGHLHLLAPIPHQALHKLALRHGPLMSIRLGSVYCVVASSAEIAKEFLKTHELVFADRPLSKAVSYLTYGSADFSFAPYGNYWRFMKKICMTQLLGGRTLDQLQPIRQEETVQFLETLFKKSDKGERVDLGKELVKLTNNVISKMVMSTRCSGSDEEAEEARKLVAETAELTGKFNLADYIGFCKNLDLQGFDKRLEDLHRRYDDMIEGILKQKEDERKKKAKHDEKINDLLDIMLDISDDENAEMKLTRENIKAFVLDIFAAGTDTSAITIEWAMAELIKQPGILQKAKEEIDTVIGNRRLVSEGDVQNLTYIQAIVKETLRIHPTGPMIVRESREECKISGYDIPARARLFVNVWAIGRDPKYWEDPLEFRPERFVKDNIDVRGQHFHLLPFGSGRRGCPGTSLAMHVVETTLACMIQCFDWKVEGGDVDMSEGQGLTLPRAQPLVCQPVARMSLMPWTS